ncbi:MAG: tetratricopeptide repeat protein, partial [Thermoanaerobaculia bacterium]
PGNGRAWMNFGLTALAKGDYRTAKQLFDRAATLTPNYSVLEINQGIVEGELGDLASAERHFQRALALNPDANAHFYYARWLVKNGRAAEALLHLQATLRLSPAFAEARALLLKLYAALAAPELTNFTEETRRIDPASLLPQWPDYDAALKAGLAAMVRKDWLLAAHANREALRHRPRSADAYNNLGWSLAQAGLQEQAKLAYAAALAIDPNHERAKNNLRLLQ